MRYLLPALCAGVVLLILLRDRLRLRKKRQERDFQRRLELVLLPKETVKAVCPQKKGYCVLTNKRVLFTAGETFNAVTVKDIKRTQGMTAEGKKTTSIPKMTCLILKAEQEHSVANTGEEFATLAKPLIAAVQKQNQKKKAKKSGK